MFERRISNGDGSHELVMEIKGKKWHWQGAEVCLEDRGDTADVIESVGVAEVKRVIVSSFKHLGDRLGLPRASSFAIYAFVVESYESIC